MGARSALKPDGPVYKTEKCSRLAPEPFSIRFHLIGKTLWIADLTHSTGEPASAPLKNAPPSKFRRQEPAGAATDRAGRNRARPATPPEDAHAIHGRRRPWLFAPRAADRPFRRRRPAGRRR